MAQVTVKEYAGVKGISERAVLKQINAGKLNATRRGRSWRIELGEDRPANGSTNPSGMAPHESGDGQTGDALALLRAKVKKEQATAALKDMEARQRSGELLEKSTVAKQAADCARKVRDNILRISGKCAPEWAAETDPHKLELLIDAELRAALEELSDEIEQDAEPDEGEE